MPDQPFHNFDISQFWPNNLSFTPGPNSGCLPLNLLGEGVANPAAVDWIMTNSLTQSKLTQNVFNAYVSGPIPGISLPAGPIEAVAGVEWRRETSHTDTPPEDQAGLTFGNVIFPTDGNFDVKEAFAEVRVPLLKHLPFAEVLQVSGAVRLSDYSTVGNTTTWNLGSIWSPVRDVTFRGTVAQSVRAPDISELFSPDSQTFNFINDPCDVTHLNEGTSFRTANCTAILSALGINPTTYTDPNSANIPGNQHGNASLREETAKSYTYGTVLRPRFAPGLAIAIDYYDINIKKAINTATAQEVADNCVDQPTIDNVFCNALTRSTTTGGINGFTVQPENVASFRTRGIDFNANYTIDPASLGIKREIGLLGVTLVGNRLDRLTTVPTPGAQTIDQRTTQYAPKWQAQLDLTWTLGGLRVNYGYNYFSPTTRYTLLTLAGDPDEASHADIFFNSRHTHDLSVAYDFLNAYRVYAGVNNLTNQRPDLNTGYPVSPVGRFIFAGVKVDFGAMR
jgi:outer membrane receptor protein involved in Fe transport